MNSLKYCFCLLCLIVFSSSDAKILHRDFWPEWAVHDPHSTAVISHQTWQNFLDKNIISNKEGINLINYGQMRSNDKKSLANYIHHLTKINIIYYNRSEQLAYWINLYNALCIQLITKYYPIRSIEEINISPGLFSIGPWNAKIITISNISLSLSDIQNRIVRPIWNDPRIHYAFSNTSIGGANLSQEAYQGNRLETQLNKAANLYINSLRGLQIIEGELVISKIYEWAKEDFGGDDLSIIYHLKQYAKPALYRKLSAINRIEGYVYNWYLNQIHN